MSSERWFRQTKKELNATFSNGVRPNESSVAPPVAKAPSVNSIFQKVRDVKQGKMSENAVENANAAIPNQNGQNTAPAANMQESRRAATGLERAKKGRNGKTRRSPYGR